MSRQPTGNPPGRRKGTLPPRRYTVRVVVLMEPVTAAALDRVRQGDEGRGAVARRILVDALAAMAAEEEGDE